MRARAAVKPDSDDVGGGVPKSGHGRAEHGGEVAEPDEDVEGSRVQEALVAYGLFPREVRHVTRGIQAQEPPLQAQPSRMALGEPTGERPPDGARPTVARKAEAIVGPPRRVVAAQPDGLAHVIHIHRRHAVTDPGARQLLQWVAPDLHVVGLHEERGDLAFTAALRPAAKLRSIQSARCAGGESSCGRARSPARHASCSASGSRCKLS